VQVFGVVKGAMEEALARLGRSSKLPW
jgi:hypothetical protein